LQGDTSSLRMGWSARAGPRALCLRPQDMAWRWLDDAALELAFSLRGCYATGHARAGRDLRRAA
jgi:tRNA(Glu) U13 pseudouridine synthase TruD